jgi:hypothetical protein
MRNADEHGADLETQRRIRLAKYERAIRRLYRAGNILPPHERHPFRDPIADELSKSLCNQERWVTLIERVPPWCNEAGQNPATDGAAIAHGIRWVESHSTTFTARWSGFFPSILLMSSAGDGLNPIRRVACIQHKYSLPSSGRLASSRRYLSEDRCCGPF